MKPLSTCPDSEKTPLPSKTSGYASAMDRRSNRQGLIYCTSLTGGPKTFQTSLWDASARIAKEDYGTANV